MLKVEPTDQRGPIRPPEVAQTALTLKNDIVIISITKTDIAVVTIEQKLGNHLLIDIIVDVV